MVSPVITAKPSASVKEAAKLFLEHRISAVPVVDDQGEVVGIVSEGDLIHLSEIGTERKRSWWLLLVAGEETLASEYIKTHAKRVADVMTSEVITASPDTPLQDVAMMMERHAIKRVPIPRDGQLVGIVSRANLAQAAATSGAGLEMPISDATVRDKLMAHLKTQSWMHTRLLDATVNDGIVNLWGFSNTEIERNAIRVAAETMPGVRAVNDHMLVMDLTG